MTDFGFLIPVWFLWDIPTRRGSSRLGINKFYYFIKAFQCSFHRKGPSCKKNYYETLQLTPFKLLNSNSKP